MGLGPNIVERRCTAVVEDPSAEIATRVGQPERRHAARARFVKPTYPPTVPAATAECTILIFKSELVQVRVERPDDEGAE